MAVKSKVKKLFKKVISPYHSFRKFFGSTNTNLLITIFILMFLILNIETPKTKLDKNNKEFELILKDLAKFQSFNNFLPKKEKYNFLIIKKRLESIEFKSDSSEIIYKADLEKFVYKNIKLKKEEKRKVVLEFNSLKCLDNYCFFD